MMDVLLAAPGIRLEPALVSRAPAHGVRVLRRCVDAADLLAAATAEPTACIAVSSALPRLSVDLLDAPGRGGRVVGLAADQEDAERLRGLGIARVIVVGDDPDAVLAALVSACTPGPDRGVWPAAPTVASDGGRAVVPGGRLLAVWGPMGAPGRTTVAIGVAEQCAEQGHRTLLVDADTYAPSVAMALGIVEEGSGLVAACRRAELAGPLPAAVVSARSVAEGWDVITGLPDADRWVDLRPAALDLLWEGCRAAYDVTVVDVGFCLEADDGGAWSRPRNAAAVSAVRSADTVLAVADASAAGALRLAAAWPSLDRLRADAPVTVLRNRARGRDRAWEQAVGAGGVRAAIRPLPADDRGMATCWRTGRTPREAARRSPVRRALGELTRTLVSG